MDNFALAERYKEIDKRRADIEANLEKDGIAALAKRWKVQPSTITKDLKVIALQNERKTE